MKATTATDASLPLRGFPHVSAIGILFTLIAILTWTSSIAQSDMGKIEFRVVAEHHDGRKSVSNVLAVQRPATLYIPSAFTPDGDGINDVFQPKGEGIATYQLAIYDRWGTLIHRSQSPSQPWDGTTGPSAMRAPEGVYAYQVVAVGADNEHIERTGSVTLIIP